MSATHFVEVDVSGAAYSDGHVPGAVLWNAYTDLRRPDYTLVDDAELEALVRRSGIENDSAIVFYGYGAHLGYWLMTSHGHPDVRLLEGPADRSSTDVPQPEPTSYVLARARRPSLEDVRGFMGDDDVVILDVRSRLEYDGERFWPSGAAEEVGRPGRIPGSVHVPIEALRHDDGTYRDAEEMRAALEQAGATPDKRVVTYCTIGNRASQAWFALDRLLGYPSADVYYGSWAEWGMRPDTPVE